MSLTQKHQHFNTFTDLNVRASFDNKTASSNVTFTYLEAFKTCIGFKKIVSKNISYQKYSNSQFFTQDIIDFMIDAVILGSSRFLHMDDLRKDPVYRKIKNNDAPSEKVCRDLLKILSAEASNELRTLNKQLLSLQAKNEQAREIMFDFDDTVCTVFGNQERSDCGYNPRYHGRPSFKEKVGIIAQSHELLDLTLEEGTHHSNFNFLDFLKSCINTLPDSWYLKIIRADRGFFDQKTFIIMKLVPSGESYTK